MVEQNEKKPREYIDGIPVWCAYDEIVPIGEIKPNAKNPNQHPDEQIQLLGHIIRQAGWRRPITVSTLSGLLVKGHGRLLAAQLEGFTMVPVEYQHYESIAAEEADLVADNRIAELAEIDNKMLADIFADIDTGEIPMELTGYTEEEVEDIVSALSEALHNDLDDPDEVPEAPKPEETFSQLGDLWILGNHRLLCGDSTNLKDVEFLMNGEKANLYLTDPPYNVNYTDGQENERKILNDFFATDEECGQKLWLPAFENARSVSDQYCAIYCFMPQGGTHMMMMMMMMMAKAGWQVKHELVWVKNSIVLNRADYNYQHEPFVYGWNEKHKFYGKGKFKNTSVWQIDRPTKSKEHPTMKPVELFSEIMLNSSQEDDLVLDTFGGSGTTLIAAEQEGRRARLMELDPKYVDVIVRRYIRTTGKNDIRLIRNGEEQRGNIFESMLSE